MNVLAALGGCGYLHISISSAQHRGWCRRAPPRSFHQRIVCCANQSWRGENVDVGDKRRVIIRVKGNSARFGIDRWNGAWRRANRPLFHRSK